MTFDARCSVIVSLLLASLSLSSCTRRALPSAPPPRDGASSTSAATRVPPPAERELSLVQHALKALDLALPPAQTAALLGGTLGPKTSPVSLSVVLASPSPTVILDLRPDSQIEAIRFGFDSARPLRLQDMSAAFGGYHSIHEGEESSVRFQSPTGIRMFVWLFSSRVLPDAPILRIALYADDGHER